MIKRAFVFILGLLSFGSTRNVASPQSSAEIMSEMRLKWFALPGSEESKDDKVRAVIVDFPMSGVIVTILASSDGDGSLYTTSSFGVIGGIGHESVRRASAELIKVGERYRPQMAKTNDYSRPDSNHFKAFVVTTKEVRQLTFSFSGEVPDDTIAKEFLLSANEVMTQLRLIKSQ